MAMRGASKSAEASVPSFFNDENGHAECKQICRYSDTLVFYRSDWPSEVSANQPRFGYPRFFIAHNGHPRCKQICRGFGPLVFYRSQWPSKVQADLPRLRSPRFLSLRMAIKGASRSADARPRCIFAVVNGHPVGIRNRPTP